MKYASKLAAIAAVLWVTVSWAQTEDERFQRLKAGGEFRALLVLINARPVKDEALACGATHAIRYTTVSSWGAVRLTVFVAPEALNKGASAKSVMINSEEKLFVDAGKMRLKGEMKVNVVEPKMVAELLEAMSVKRLREVDRKDTSKKVIDGESSLFEVYDGRDYVLVSRMGEATDEPLLSALKAIRELDERLLVEEAKK